MKKNTVLKILNPVLLVLIISQITTGMLGMQLPYAVFNVLHRGGGWLLGVLILVHLSLNFNWVKANYFKK